MTAALQNGRVMGHSRRQTFLASRKTRCTAGVSGPRAYEGQAGNQGTADSMGSMGRRCTRIACTAVVALMFFGDSTSARSSIRPDSTSSTWHGGEGPSGHHPHRLAWQFFTPSSKTTPKPSRSSALQKSRKSSLPSPSGDAANRRPARLQVGTAAAGAGSSTALSPAHIFRVSRRRELGRNPSVGDGDRRGGVDISTLQSPRSAVVGEDGRDYPELLTVYSAGDSSPSATEEVAVFAGGAEGGRPALPELNEEDLTQLRAGQRVQKQTRDGGAGSGSVVVDVRADPDVVLGLLTKYEDYAEMIDTVRECEVIPLEEADSRKVEVTVSRFRLHIRVVMSFLRERNMVKFELDPDCTKAGRAVLREATGFFFVESPPDRPGYSRVWMLAKVNVNRFVPGGVVDYASGRALPRASNWIKPTCEAAQRRKMRALGT